jgi:hypothetical protein
MGSLLKSIADHFMARRANTRDRWYQEKRKAYLGLLEALHDTAVRPMKAPRHSLCGKRVANCLGRKMLQGTRKRSWILTMIHGSSAMTLSRVYFRL